MKFNLFSLVIALIVLASGHSFTVGDGRILDRLMGRSRVIHEHRITYSPVIPTVIYSRPATPMIPPCPVNLAPLPAVPKFGER